MPDRRRRTALHLPPPAGPVLLPRERQSSSTGSPGTPGSSDSSDAPETQGSGSSTGSTGPSGSSPAAPSEPSGSTREPSGAGEDNPFAPPPEGTPDRPWQPRLPENGGSADDGSGSGRGGWGSQWSSRQPGRSSGGFGSRPGAQQGQGGQSGQDGGQDGPDGGRGGLRWDPTDVSQRRARYALLGGMWALFFVLFDLPEVALLLGSLAVYWGASSLRNKNKPKAADAKDGAKSAVTDGSAGASGSSPAAVRLTKTAPDQGASSSTRPQRTAAVSGLVAAALALLFVATTFGVRLAYPDYYSCVNDALTKTGQLSCNELLPHSLERVFGVKE
ncbi:hypothetical protein [Streptomyces paludis]|uniref:Integral membrane protein n=1 Tax=Streptomyces paludis TaxID=2282738 RepID=A0A345HSX6_9ACTN|nr:hypothetical protein [Streptomyces paludis]AXG79800.1 hypothetical protein DVK44_21510 [Streptomyces paludis]